jgi:hypothetical protein
MVPSMNLVQKDGLKALFELFIRPVSSPILWIYSFVLSTWLSGILENLKKKALCRSHVYPSVCNLVFVPEPVDRFFKFHMRLSLKVVQQFQFLLKSGKNSIFCYDIFAYISGITKYLTEQRRQKCNTPCAQYTFSVSTTNFEIIEQKEFCRCHKWRTIGLALI